MKRTRFSSIRAPFRGREQVGEALYVHHARSPARDGDRLLP